MMPLAGRSPLSLILLVFGFSFVVEATEVSTAEDAASSQEVEAWTLDGHPLYRKTFHGFEKAGLDAQLSIALENLRVEPKDDPTKHVWHGRRLAYQWKYQEAISVYSTQLPKWPDYAPLHRHRGHSYISTRNFTKAQNDLQKAADLIAAQGDIDGWEPDGKPNRYNLPLYSRHYNIYYHLGLSHYLQGNFTGAVQAYDELTKTLRKEDGSKRNFASNDAIAAAVYWKYMALRPAGHGAHSRPVRETLQWIHPHMEVLDVGTYLQLCYFFKGMGPIPDLDKASDPLDFATLAYGVGNYYFFNGRHKRAVQVWKQVVQNSTYWPAFGFIATEADLFRLKHQTGADEQVAVFSAYQSNAS